MKYSFRMMFFTAIVVFWCNATVIVQASPNVLTVGSQGTNVSVLQQKLAEAGFYQGTADGVFGNATRNAVMDFQRSCGIYADGVAGPDTLEKLRAYRGQAVMTSRSGSSRRGQQIVNTAMQYLGVPYVWAGASPAGFDCSGFITYVFRQQNVSLPRMADEQFAVGTQVPLSQLQAGDLLFFSTYEPGPSHVGIYIGNGSFIHASSGAGHVKVTSLSSSYYQSRFLGAKRVL
ncbi:MAG: NlpC/P60 family protein [Sporomusaceae bacterium]|nr:NlpC/P60 family protein [Sporomusaceae bacterium]